MAKRRITVTGPGYLGATHAACMVELGCEALGMDVADLAAALRLDPRIGSRFLEPGLGFGGACLPKDIRGFAARAREAARAADVIVHATEWPEFRDIDPVDAAGWGAELRIADCRNKLDDAAWRTAGWELRALGSPARNHLVTSRELN